MCHNNIKKKKPNEKKAQRPLYQGFKEGKDPTAVGKKQKPVTHVHQHLIFMNAWSRYPHPRLSSTKANQILHG